MLLIGNLGWTAISASANVVYDFLTLGILVYAGVKVRSAKKEAQISRTLAVCDRFDTDPVLDKATRRLSKAARNNKLQTQPLRSRVLRVTELLDVGSKPMIENGVLRGPRRHELLNQ